MLYKSYIVENDLKVIKENISLFYGENLGLKNEIKYKIKRSNAKNEIVRFFQDDLIKNKNLLFSELKNISLFEKNKIFFIDNANDKILELIEEIVDEVENHKIYLFSDILEKKSKLRNFIEKSKNCAAIPCYNDNEITIKKIIQSKLKDFKGLTSQNLNLILDHTNLDRSKLYNELNKIITYFDNKTIKTEELENLLNLRLNDDFNKLKNESLSGDKIKTNKLLSDTIIEPEKNILYLNIINQSLFRLLEIYNMKENNVENAINKLRPNVFWKDKSSLISQANKWNKNKLKKILKDTYNLEKNIKSNAIINKNILIKKLIIDMCKTANS